MGSAISTLARCSVWRILLWQSNLPKTRAGFLLTPASTTGRRPRFTLPSNPPEGLVSLPSTSKWPARQAAPLPLNCQLRLLMVPTRTVRETSPKVQVDIRRPQITPTTTSKGMTTVKRMSRLSLKSVMANKSRGSWPSGASLFAVGHAHHSQYLFGVDALRLLRTAWCSKLLNFICLRSLRHFLGMSSVS